MAGGRKRRGWTVLAAVGAALILAGVGAGVSGWLAPSASWLARAVGAGVGAVAGLVAAIWVDRISQRREAKKAALSARHDVLDALVADPAGEGSIFDALLATSTKAAPFRGRRDDLAWLDRWWEDPKQAPVVVVSGPAGTGKTRLATQFAQGRPMPWVSGWLREGCGADAVAAIRACGDEALILVDDPGQRPDLAVLLASLNADRGTGPTVRVILISRAAGLVSRLAATLDDRSRGMLDGVRELPLGPFGGADDRARWFGEAVRAYARARQVPPPDLPTDLSGYVTDPAEPILTLHAQALLAVLDSEGSRPIRPPAEGQPFDQVAAALFAHEQHRWQASARHPEFGLTDLTSPVQSDAIAALLLASPADQEQAAALLRRVPELATASAERRANIARWAAYLYPCDPPWPIQVKPDMLAEWFTITQLMQTPELVDLLGAMDPQQKAAMLLLLAHASDHMPQAVQLFADIVGADTSRLAETGVTAALSASAGQRRLDGELARLILQASWSADALGRVEDKLRPGLPRTQAAVAEVRVKIARADGDAAGLAGTLGSLGVRLSQLGRHQEALLADEESVGLWRPLARDNPACQPDLARALRYLGFQLHELGRYREAVAATEEAVGLWRPLAPDNPACQPDLARALRHLGNHLARLGRHREALEATEESVGLCRPLAQDNPAHQPDLAWALGNLGARLSQLGRHQQALACCEEAVSVWRALARDNPTRQPGLAGGLEELGNGLENLGRYREAVAATGEAVGLWRPLARDNPAHRPDVARALRYLGNQLAGLGRHQEALKATEEAVSLWRPLAQDNPAHQPELAEALNHLGSHLGALGERQNAAAPAEESVALWRALARDNPAHQPGLGRALCNLGYRLHTLGRYQEALEATEESVGLWRPLARDIPRCQPDLARALLNLGTILDALGRQQDALAAWEESVELLKVLARSNPGRNGETYYSSLTYLRRYLDLTGQESASIRLHLTNDSADGGKPRHVPSMPNLQEE